MQVVDRAQHAALHARVEYLEHGLGGVAGQQRILEQAHGEQAKFVDACMVLCEKMDADVVKFRQEHEGGRHSALLGRVSAMESCCAGVNAKHAELMQRIGEVEPSAWCLVDRMREVEQMSARTAIDNGWCPRGDAYENGIDLRRRLIR
jgi:hypothetical protein